jgi:Transposase
MRVIGMDIHRTFAEVVFWEAGQLRPAGRIDMTRSGLEGFGRSLSKQDEVVVEATGNAMAVVRVLGPYVARVIVANPLQVKAIAHAHVKTDKIDAGVLASLRAAGFLPEVWLPDADTERRRRLVARRNQVVRHRDVLLIGGDEHADAPRVRRTDELGARRGQMTRQHIHHRRGERAVSLIVALTDNQEMIAPVNRPHAVGVEVGQRRPPRGEHIRCPRCSRTQPKQRTPIHTHQHQARRRSPPRLRVFPLRFEDVRCDTQVRHVHQLRDVEIDGGSRSPPYRPVRVSAPSP